MNRYLVKEDDLTAIADAIREKKGTTAPILFEEFAERITSIQTPIVPPGACITSSSTTVRLVFAGTAKSVYNIRLGKNLTHSITREVTQ